MNTKDLIIGIQLLDTYRDKPEGHTLCAEHDTLYIEATDRPLSGEDVKKMQDLGFIQEGVGEGEYEQEESWVAYV